MLRKTQPPDSKSTQPLVPSPGSTEQFDRRLTRGRLCFAQRNTVAEMELRGTVLCFAKHSHPT
jgi:hypothetical protein